MSKRFNDSDDDNFHHLYTFFRLSFMAMFNALNFLFHVSITITPFFWQDALLHETPAWDRKGRQPKKPVLHFPTERVFAKNQQHDLGGKTALKLSTQFLAAVALAGTHYRHIPDYRYWLWHGTCSVARYILNVFQKKGWVWATGLDRKISQLVIKRFAGHILQISILEMFASAIA